MSLRLKLLLLSLLTLMLPWAGYKYAQEMETALRQAESESLTAMAKTIAASLQGRDELLYRGPTGVQVPDHYNLVPIPLPGEPYIDGYIEEWPDAPGAWKYFNHGKDRLGILTGVRDRMFYALLDVHDDKLVFDAPNASPLDPASFGDRVWLGFEDTNGLERQVFLAATGPGDVHARRIETREYGRQEAVDEPRIESAWQPTKEGYRIELRIPLSLLGGRFGVLIDDRDQLGAIANSYGTLRGDDLHTQGRLIAASPELARYLSQFLKDQSGLRLAVSTPDGAQLAMADAPALAPNYGEDGRTILVLFYRRLLDEPGQRRMIEVPAPIYDRDYLHVIGTLRVSQTVDHWPTLRDHALATLLNVTLITSAILVLAMFAFAAHLALRLARLRKASETALTREGLVTTFPESKAPDELGDVARSFSTLLHRLNEYTGYLRTLAGKLAHEIRTPLTIVRSSLDNLETEASIPDSARVYLERARQGSDRLNAMLMAMGAATRVEEAIQSAERTRFDLVPVIASAVSAYRIGFPERQFVDALTPGPLEIDGAPDLVVQLLDKLVDNAVDFSAPGATITVRLRFEAHYAVLEVENPGPPLPKESHAHLFESLWQSRAGSDHRPHFGLGLYIVKLIAEFHGGFARAEDLPDASGARFSIWLRV
jgi:two-component system, OmpR family, sensor histidine kinase ChvG